MAADNANGRVAPLRAAATTAAVGAVAPPHANWHAQRLGQPQPPPPLRMLVCLAREARDHLVATARAVRSLLCDSASHIAYAIHLFSSR